MADFRLTLLDNYRVEQGVGFELYVKFEVLPDGVERQKAFRFPIDATDAVIQQEIQKWFDSQVAIHSEAIARNNAQARLEALQETLNQVVTV